MAQAAQAVEVLLREENIIVHRWKDEPGEWVDGGRGGFRIYKSGSVVWLGLIQPGGRNVLANDIVIKDTTQLWANGDTLRINYLDKAGETKKIAFCPLRSSLNLEDAVDEHDFEDFVKDTEPAEPEEPSEPTADHAPTSESSSGGPTLENAGPTTTSQPGAGPNTESQPNAEASQSDPGPTTTSPSDAGPRSEPPASAVATPEKVDPLAGKQSPSFPAKIANILQSNTAIYKVKLSV